MANDPMKINDLQQKLLEAMNIVTGSVVQGISYDKTVLCTIIDDTQRDFGKYIVSEGNSVSYAAYTNDTNLSNDMSVYVVIPNGDYSMQKMIIGRKVSGKDEPFIYVNPMSTVVDLTQNIINETAVDYKGLIANHPTKTSYRVYPDETKHFYENMNLNNGLGYVNFTRLGLQADFRSFLTEAVAGSYGLKVTLYDKKENLTGTSWETGEHILLFDCSEMYGNPYDFESYYQQEKVFDISELGTITGITIDFYQIPGSFKDAYGQDISYLDEEGEEIQWPNLRTQDIYVCLGYDLGTFQEEKVDLYTFDTTVFSNKSTKEQNHKKLYLRWVHMEDNGSPTVITEKSERDFEVRWYRYKLGAPSADNYSGVYWERIPILEHVGLAGVDIGSFNLYQNPLHYNKYYLNYSNPNNINLNTSREEIVRNPKEDGWNDLFRQDFIYHPEGNDYLRFGFWEKIALAYRIYWLAPERFDELGVSDIWRKGGTVKVYGEKEQQYLTEQISLGLQYEHKVLTYDAYLKAMDDLDHKYCNPWFFDFINKNPYVTNQYEYLSCIEEMQIAINAIDRADYASDLEYEQALKDIREYYTNELHKYFDSEVYKFCWSNITDEQYNAMTGLLTCFTESFGEWKYIEEPGTGLGNLIPKDIDTYTQLLQAAEQLFAVIDNPSRVITKRFEWEFDPDVSKQDERIKVIVLYNNMAYRSQILTFNNQEQVANKATLDNMSALGIVCVDEVYKDATFYSTYGNYLIYDEANNIMDASEAKKTRQFMAVFNLDGYDETENSILTEADHIIWGIPAHDTMIHVDGFDYETDTPIAAGVSYDAVNDLILIRRNCADHSPDRNDGIIDAYQPYTIGSYYSSGYANNTIQCEIVKDQMTYRTQKELTFGQSGTTGTDCTLVLDFDNNKTSLAAGSGDSVVVTARLYDANNIEQNIEGLNIVWNWFRDTGTDGYIYTSAQGTTYKPGTTYYFYDNVVQDFVVAQGNYINPEYMGLYYTREYGHSVSIIMGPYKDKNGIYRNNKTELLAHGLGITDLYIISCTVKGWGDYPLTAYLPIPVRHPSADPRPAYITGAKDIIYNSQGTARYYKKPYYLHQLGKEDPYPNIKWRMNYTAATSGGGKRVPDIAYLPNIIHDAESDTYKLSPVDMFVEGLPPCGVFAYSIDDDGTTETILWNQPILIIQNNYPSAMINQWDGKSLVLDHETGSILSSRVSAGKKNAQNQFSGVLMGEWGDETDDSIKKGQTGLYGFQDGSMSYAFKEDGTAFIGKAGKSRIYFDGNKGDIQSASYAENQTGMKIDLDDGYFDIRGFSEKRGANTSNSNVSYTTSGSRVQIRADGLPYFEIRSEEKVNKPSKQLIHIGKDSYYLQTDDYSPSAETGVRLDLGSGKLIGYDFKIKTADSRSGGQIKIQSDGSPYLEINDGSKELFYMSNSSYYLQSSDYDPRAETGVRFDLDSGKLTGYDFTIKAKGSNGNITLSSKNSEPFVVRGDGENGGTFKVGWDGSVDADLGKIGGWKIGKNTLSSNDDTIVLDSASGKGILLKNKFLYIGNTFEDNFGKVGFLAANTGDAETDSNSEGVGCLYDKKDGIKSQVKATSYNAGLSYISKSGHGYISISGSQMSFGHTLKVECKAPADKQFGIYARFA